MGLENGIRVNLHTRDKGIRGLQGTRVNATSSLVQFRVAYVGSPANFKNGLFNSTIPNIVKQLEEQGAAVHRPVLYKRSPPPLP